MILSLILGLISWGIALKYIISKKGNSEKYIVASCLFTAFGLLNEIYSYQSMALKEDITAFLDVALVGFYPALVLTAVTSVLNVFIIVISRKDN